MKRVERVRLYPSARQTRRLEFILDVTRDLYNAMLQERRDAYRYRGVAITAGMQRKEITALRTREGRVDGRLAAVYRECEDAVAHRLDLTFQGFFKRCALGDAPGYPRYKPRSRWTVIGFPHGQRALKIDAQQRGVTIPGIGWVRLRKGRRIPFFRRAWLIRRNGRWHACFECEREMVPLPRNGRCIGVDRGVDVLAATSEGILIENPQFGKRCRVKIATHRRALADLTERNAFQYAVNKRDPRRAAAALRLSRALERESNRRRDFLHKTARKIVNSADTIALEYLPVASMMRSAKGTIAKPGRNVAAKTSLNRRLRDAAFYQFERLIVEKAVEAARTVLWVDARFSSQKCSHCGHISSENRRRRRFCCVCCGFVCHADVNAALVIRRRAELQLLRGPHAGAEPALEAMLTMALTTKSPSPGAVDPVRGR